MEVAITVNNFLYDQIMPQLPKKWMSHMVGRAAHCNIPSPLSRKLVARFAKMYQIDLDEIEKPIEDYKTLGEFFSRKLKSGARPITGDLIHPCDGKLIESGKIHEKNLIQAKGKAYSVTEFLPENPWQSDFNNGSFFTYYLAPHNYHRVHSPVSGQVQWTTVVPGELWPVNSWSVKNVDGLYAINERVITGIETPQGKVILVMVGATNVGSISLSFDLNVKTNNPQKSEIVFRSYKEGRGLKVGQEFGTFHLGSTVVVLFDEKWKLPTHLGRKAVLMGQRLQ